MIVDTCTLGVTVGELIERTKEAGISPLSVLPEIVVDVDDPTVEWGLRIALLAEAAIASPLPAGTERFRFERLNILGSEKKLL